MKYVIFILAEDRLRLTIDETVNATKVDSFEECRRLCAETDCLLVSMSMRSVCQTLHVIPQTLSHARGRYLISVKEV